MGRKKARFTVAFCTAMALFMLASGLQANQFDPDRVTFKKLKYAASKFFISVDTDVRFQQLTAEEAMAQMISPPKGDYKSPQTDAVTRLSLKTEVMGLHSDIDLWMDPDTTALQRTSLTTGLKDRYRTFRYSPEGAYSIKRRPKNSQEEDKSFDQWNEINEDYYVVPEEEQALPLSETEGLFYLVAASNISEPGDELKAYVFNEKGSIEARLKVEEKTRIKVKFDETNPEGKKNRIKEEIDVLRIRVTAQPYLDKGSDAIFKFLGYKGDIDMFYDPKRRVVVQVSGKIDYLGTVHIKLKEAEFFK